MIQIYLLHTQIFQKLQIEKDVYKRQVVCDARGLDMDYILGLGLTNVADQRVATTYKTGRLTPAQIKDIGKRAANQAINLLDVYKRQGIDRYAIKGGKYKDIGADYRDLTSEEKNILQTMVDENYESFVANVAQNRKLSKEYVENIAEGQVYTGKQAKKLKLIDEIGGKDHALDIAAKLGGIHGSYEVITMKSPQSFSDVLNTLSSKIGYSIGKGIGSLLKEDTIQSAMY